MTINTKLEKTKKSSEGEKAKLLELVSSKAKKKKILKQVVKVQALEKETKKLAKKLKSKKATPEVVVKKEEKKSTPAETPIEAQVIEDSTSELSTNFNAREAVSKLSTLESKSEIEAFILGEERKSVLARANVKLSGLTK